MNVMNSQKNISDSQQPSTDSDNTSMSEADESLGQELTITEWRLMLSAFARNLQKGDVSPVTANAFANLMGKGMNSYKLQLEYAKALGRTPTIPALMPTDRTGK